MTYNIGDNVRCFFYVIGNKKHLCTTESDFLKDSVDENMFEIIGMDERQETYKILIPDDFIGWKIGRFHINYEKIDEKHLGKMFYDISGSLIM